MSEHKVEIIETLRRVVTVNANNIEEAEDIVKRQYANEEIVLDSSDFLGCDINDIQNI